MTEPAPDVVCLSHLAWEETLFQRPQQIMLALARRRPGRRVLYVGRMGARAWLRAAAGRRDAALRGRPLENLEYLNLPHLPLTRRFPPLRAVADRRAAGVAGRLARRRGFGADALLWLYHPGYAPYAERVPHGRLVYDCMDEFAAFEGACERDRRLERDLLRAADVVFTGGRSLHTAKEGVNPRTWCFPSGVDFAHFGRAATEDLPEPEDLAALARPRFGYFGAIDERVDFGLLGALGEAFPGGTVVLLGPLVHPNPPWPDAPNVRWLGPKAYADLPAYLRGFDVCLMPFVDSVLTRSISPTKTPEYLCGGKPVVSTPVPDVVRDYGDLTAIAAGPEAFVEAVRRALESPAGDLAQRLRERAAARSWDRIAEEMETLIFEGGGA